MLQLRSQLRGPMHALMEKNEALRRQVDEKDKAIEELTAQLSIERHSVARKVEAGLQPLKIQVAEYERNIEDLIERLEQMDAVRATLTRVQEENTTMQRTIDLQVRPTKADAVTVVAAFEPLCSVLTFMHISGRPVWLAADHQLGGPDAPDRRPEPRSEGQGPQGRVRTRLP